METAIIVRAALQAHKDRRSSHVPRQLSLYNIHSQPGVQLMLIPHSLSESIPSACSKARKYLQQMNIDPEEEDMLRQAKSIEDVEDLRAFYVQEIETKLSKTSKVWKKVDRGSKFVRRVLDVFQQANFSPECSLALGLVGLFLIQPVSGKTEIEERLQQEIEELDDILAQVKFTKNYVKTAEVSHEVQGLCATIVDFLAHAIHYQKKWSIVKMMGSLVTDFTQRFQSFVEKIKGHSSKINMLAQQAYTTILIESKEVLDATCQKIHDLHYLFSVHAETTTAAISRIAENIQLCQITIDSQARVEASKYIHQLSKALLPDSFDLPDPMVFIRHQETALSPRERWENNIPEMQTTDWLGCDPRPMLWIGGRANHRSVSWVSSFSADLVEASEAESGIEVAPVFCQDGSSDKKQSPVLVFKKLIIKLLKKYPEVLSLPEYMDGLPVERFEHVLNSPERAFRLLSDILRMVDRYCQEKRKEIFLLIEHVENCLDGESDHERKRFIEALQKLNAEYQTLRIILTGERPWQETGLSLEGVAEIWVDTTKAVAMHSRY